AKDTLCIGALLHRRQIFDWKHHALVLISYVKNLRNRRSLLVPLRGFTLAEVLITLGIIGVVAALTIPTLMQKTDERETVAKVNKVFSTIKNAVNLAISENGSPSSWDVDYVAYRDDDEITKLASYIKPYLNISKDCGTSESGCMYDGMYKALNGDDKYVYSSIDGIYRFLLNDGTSLFMSTSANGGELDNNLLRLATVYIDVNNEKGPNQIGKDLFVMFLNNNGVSLPSESCSLYEGDGGGCVEYIIINKNMDYLNE
ncbi:type II secretion system protein, partial [bacterium]|nr:type II secretion system protein [bacterium]